MKQCPACGTTYTDTSLRFCLSDGTALRDLTTEQPTVVHSQTSSTAETIATTSGRQQMRVDIPSEQVGFTPPIPQPVPAAASSSGGMYKILVVILVLGFLALLAIGAAGFIYFSMSSSSKVVVDANKDVKATPAQSPGKDDKDELRDQIANLEKQLTDQKKKPANIPSLTMPDQPMTTTARVNSPGDGFLALRTLPNSEIGERILKIPHASIISVGACGPLVTPAKRSGRWCQATYDGYKGWVFDAYLIY